MQPLFFFVSNHEKFFPGDFISFSVSLRVHVSFSLECRRGLNPHEYLKNLSVKYIRYTTDNYPTTLLLKDEVVFLLLITIVVLKLLDFLA